MSNVGQAALTIGGAFVGSLFGAPHLGLLVGSYAGSFLFPTELPGIKGPRLKELNIQTSTIGVPIPIVYGTYALAGNVIWSGGLIEEKDTDEVGGKGGPSQEVTTYTYFVDLAVGICEGPIQGIRKIWADAVVIYDLSPQRDDETDDDYNERIATSQQTAALMTVYTGTESQLADPVIESYEGVGNVPGYRGLAYVVFDHLPLEKYGNRIPNLRFEVYTGTASDVDCTQYSAGNLKPWVEGGRDPRNELNNHIYTVSTVEYDTFAAAAAALEAAANKTLFTSDEYLHGWKKTAGANQQSPCHSINSDDNVSLYLLYNVVGTTLRDCDAEYTSAPGTNSCDKFKNFYGVGTVVWQPGSQHGLYVVVANGEGEEQYFNGYSGSGSVSCADSAHYVTDIADVRLQVTRSTKPPSGCENGAPLANAPGYCVVDGRVVPQVTWTETAGTYKVLQAYADNGVTVTSYPVNPCLPQGHEFYNDQAYWENAYAEALANGEPIASGLTYGVDYPTVVSTAWVGECTATAIDTVCVPVADIVEDICERAGLTAVDTSDISSCTLGYCITRVMSARDALEPLRTYGLFDTVESGFNLKFVERGHAAAATLTADDLCAHESGGARPTAMEVARVQEKELPRRLRLHYASPDRNYEPGEQAASRITTEAVTEEDVELAISMEDDNAAQLAEILLYERWVARNTYRFALDNTWLALEPTDCLIVPVDGQNERVRITAVDYSIGGIMRIEAVRDDDGSYVSTAAGNAPTPSGTQGGGTSAIVCPSEAIYLDLPSLRSQDTDAGYYAAVYGTCSTWSCAAIYRSSDNGTTYGRVAETQTQATVGTIQADVPGVGSPADIQGSPIQYDNDSVIYVALDTIGATLSSVTEAQLLSGQNTGAIGADGRWEIIQYRTATLTSGNVWALTNLIRGVNGTSAYTGTTNADDRFVLLSGPGILRINETPAGIGVEKLLKVVTCGESLSDVTADEFTSQGLSYSPPTIGGNDNVSDSADDPGCGEFLRFNCDTALWEPSPVSLADISDIEFGSPLTDGWVLTWDSATNSARFEPAGGSGGVSDGDKGDITVGSSGTVWSINDGAIGLNELSDVVIGSPRATGNALIYDGATELWSPGPVAANDVSYDNSTSGLAATNVNSAIDELEALFSAGNPTSGLPAVAYQAANLSRTNNTPTDTDLSFDLEAGTYTFEARFIVTSHSTPDAQLNLDYSGSVSNVDITRLANAVGSTAAALRATSLPLSMTFTTTDTFFQLHFGSIEVSTSGTLKMTFHQITTSGGNPVIFHRGSWMRVQRIT